MVGQWHQHVVSSSACLVLPSARWCPSRTCPVCLATPLSQVVSSEQPKLGLMQELSFSTISESTTGYTFTPCGIFYFPWHRHQIEGTTGFKCLFRKTQANVGWTKLPKYQNGSRWDWTTVPSIESGVLPRDHHSLVFLEIISLCKVSKWWSTVQQLSRDLFMSCQIRFCVTHHLWPLSSLHPDGLTFSPNVWYYIQQWILCNDIFSKWAFCLTETVPRLGMTRGS